MEDGILAKLTEVKDVKTYVKTRLAMLEGRETDIAKNTQPEKRETAIKQLKGRKKELRKLREVLNQEGLKDYSQRNWHHVEESNFSKQNSGDEK